MLSFPSNIANTNTNTFVDFLLQETQTETSFSLFSQFLYCLLANEGYRLDNSTYFHIFNMQIYSRCKYKSGGDTIFTCKEGEREQPFYNNNKNYTNNDNNQ